MSSVWKATADIAHRQGSETLNYKLQTLNPVKKQRTIENRRSHLRLLQWLLNLFKLTHRIMQYF